MTHREYRKFKERIRNLPADPELKAVLEAMLVYIGEVDDAADCAERDAKEALDKAPAVA